MSRFTNQELFDTVATHLRTQGEPSIVDGACKYRAYVGDKILKCAAGVLIPDDKYSPFMESMSVFGGQISNICLGTPHPDLQADLLRQLQRVHDAATHPPTRSNLRGSREVEVMLPNNYDFLTNVELGLQEIARHWELNYSAPE